MFVVSLYYHNINIPADYPKSMDTKILKEIGLTETEIKAYLSLLTLGATSAGRIVEETGVYRKNLYDALNKLIEKGLVSYVIEDKIRVFQAKNPENLEKYLDEKKAKIEEQKQEIQKDFLDGQRAGVQGTPGFFVNGKVVSGAQPFSVFQQIIEQELRLSFLFLLLFTS